MGIECTLPEPNFRRSSQKDRMRQLQGHIDELHQVLQDPNSDNRSLADARHVQDNQSYSIGSVMLDSLQAGRLITT